MLRPPSDGYPLSQGGDSVTVTALDLRKDRRTTALLARGYGGGGNDFTGLKRRGLHSVNAREPRTKTRLRAGLVGGRRVRQCARNGLEQRLDILG